MVCDVWNQGKGGHRQYIEVPQFSTQAASCTDQERIACNIRQADIDSRRIGQFHYRGSQHGKAINQRVPLLV